MVTLTATLEDMKTQLTEAVRVAVEKGFELVAGVVGAKLAKSMEGAVKNAEVVCKGGGYGDIVGLREQIKDNAIILLPLMDDRIRAPTCGASVRDSDASIRVITTGNSSTGGVRAMLVEDSPYTKPRVVIWSFKHASAAGALKDLLDVTQAHLKLHLAALIDPPSPVVDNGDWIRGQFPSFDDTPSPTEPTAATSASSGAIKTKLFWDANTVTNPSFQAAGGFDYGFFDSGFSSDDATCVDPATKTWA